MLYIIIQSNASFPVTILLILTIRLKKLVIKFYFHIWSWYHYSFHKVTYIWLSSYPTGQMQTIILGLHKSGRTFVAHVRLRLCIWPFALSDIYLDNFSSFLIAVDSSIQCDDKILSCREKVAVNQELCMWCWVDKGYYKIIWFYQLSW